MSLAVQLAFCVFNFFSFILFLSKLNDDDDDDDQTFCILLIEDVLDVLSVTETANLRQRQNLNQKASGIRIWISGLIWIRMSVEYPSQNALVGVIHFAKFASNGLRTEKTEKC